MFFFQSPTFMRTLLSKYLFYIQLLSFKNTGLHIQKRNWGFNTSEMIYSSLLK